MTFNASQERAITQLMGLIDRQRDGNMGDAAIRAQLITNEGWSEIAVIEAFERLEQEGGE